ncbi:4-hydroxy-tetrahydrodipicolinate synthase [Isachenkonia alkalipeptolytica]|uniref:4-hydroxy-tetrahydrodipicolinate synthase n=1 Tax=Isachenkonia alkalipeptolytica TaxID=2565777 RepID=A0AA43XIM4_9CLOT|nr:4-hydroxy-tetrahydrodipicolinate synthase [Isachenkonia alkalipeptolytica]NBG87034.1 4-hydroxy-tetrahydrodipicolinate synthase [Isachenkonia alkalipeptolytica]
MFTGSAVAIATPFKGGKVDMESFEKLLDFQLQSKTQGIVVLGTTGEASTLSFEEREALILKTVEKARGKVPVIVGAGSNDYEKAVSFSKQGQELGADGLLLVTPYYNKATQEGLKAYFKGIAEQVDLPIILYNVPSRTNVNIEPETVEELSKIPKVVGIKEAGGDLGQVLEIKRRVPENFKIYSGNDDQILPIFASGGHGVISVVANIIPDQVQELCEAVVQEDLKSAVKKQTEMLPLIHQVFAEVNPIPIKAAISLMGMALNELRLPLTPLSEGARLNLIREMENYGLPLREATEKQQKDPR